MFFFIYLLVSHLVFHYLSVCITLFPVQKSRALSQGCKENTFSAARCCSSLAQPTVHHFMKITVTKTTAVQCGLLAPWKTPNTSSSCAVALRHRGVLFQRPDGDAAQQQDDDAAPHTEFHWRIYILQRYKWKQIIWFIAQQQNFLLSLNLMICRDHVIFKRSVFLP